jgi:hypothetical protein
MSVNIGNGWMNHSHRENGKKRLNVPFYTTLLPLEIKTITIKK